MLVMTAPVWSCVIRSRFPGLLAYPILAILALWAASMSVRESATRAVAEGRRLGRGRLG